MWDLIVNPMVTILTLLYSLLGNNIVLAIAVFTVIIRLATSPLMISQQRAMAKQQELAPKLNELKEKYKNDAEKRNQAQMALYKEHGINPLGGCLPLLVQMPILFGLYATINHALSATPYQLIDLSGRLLLPDLGRLVPIENLWLGMDLTLSPTSNPSIALSLPLFVLVTTWLQSKLTMPAPKQPEKGKEESAADQAANMTRSMTTIMPLMFGFFSLQFSVGLSIYFVVSNLVGIIQYTFMGKAQWGQLFSFLGTGESAAETGVVESTAADVPAASPASSKPKAPKAKKKPKKMKKKTAR